MHTATQKKHTQQMPWSPSWDEDHTTSLKANFGTFPKISSFFSTHHFLSYDWTTQPAVHICFLSSWGWFATQSCCWQETHCWWILGVFYHVMVDILRCFISEISTLILATLGFSTLILFPNRPDFHAVWMIRIYHIWGWVKPYCYPF